MTYQFKIQIKGIAKPPVWRRVEVPASFTFKRFHDVIQIAFGWEDYHLFQFSPKGWGSEPAISIPHEDDWEEVEDAQKIKLKDVFFAEGQKYVYIYDFGDDWEHQITLEAISDKGTRKAVCLAGKGACPPEDCRGVWGYEDMKRVLAEKPDSEEAAEWLEWLGLEKGEKWEEVNGFSLEDVNLGLKGV